MSHRCLLFPNTSLPQLLKFLLLNGQKSNIERERHGQSFLRFGSTEEIREGMGIDNRMVGYVFLVDRKGRMRWRYVRRGKERVVAACVWAALGWMQSPSSNRFSR